jgi:NAD(P)-dependent dehydrogenase (short-subunit alcohol dehydrogenase family)
MGAGKSVTVRPGDPVRDFIVGRTALITGAGNGLGRAIALELAARGARVLVTGRNVDKLTAVAAEIGDAARVATCDTASASSVAELAATLKDEEVSILVNNAGIAGPVASLTDIDVDDWDEVFAVNVRGVFLMCKAFLPPMIERGHGDVVNIASVSGKRPLARRTPYTASKMAVIGLTTTLAHEVGPLGIAVNTLSPGPVSGPRMERNFALEAARTGKSAAEAEQEFVSRAAMQRMVTEHEVALAVAAVLSMPGLCGADIDLSAGMIAP